MSISIYISRNIYFVSYAVRNVLSNIYHNGRIGRGGPTAWSPRSPDLNPLDFYVGGATKSPCVCGSCSQRRGTSWHCGCVSDYPHISVTQYTKFLTSCKWISQHLLTVSHYRYFLLYIRLNTQNCIARSGCIWLVLESFHTLARFIDAASMGHGRFYSNGELISARWWLALDVACIITYSSLL
jgi:hypothetical protein